MDENGLCLLIGSEVIPITQATDDQLSDAIHKQDLTEPLKQAIRTEINLRAAAISN